MFHVKQFFFPFFVAIQFVACTSLAQGTVSLEQKPFVVGKPVNQELDRFLSGFPSLENLSTSEKDLFYWVNLLRMDPSGFRRNYLEPFLKEFPELKGGNVKSLSRDLSSTGSLSFVAPAPHLLTEANRHATDLARKQKRLSHSASDGRNFQKRMSDAGVRNCAGENIYEGEADALKAVLLLLIDQGVPDLGHRKALLNPSFNLMGVSAVKASAERYYIVQLFSCK
jgi:hypothetical protein